MKKTTIHTTKTKDVIFTREYLLLSISAFLICNNFYSLITVVPLYSLHELKLSEAEAGVAVGLFIAGMLASRFAVGKLTEKFGFRFMLALGLTSFTVFSFSYLFVDTPAALYIVRIACGVFYGLTVNTIVTMVSTIIPKSRSGEGVGYYSMFQMSAWAVGPYIGVYFANSGNYAGVFIFAAILPVIILATLPFLRMSHIYEKAAQDDLPAPDPEEGMPRASACKESFFEKFLEPAVLPVAAICIFTTLFNTTVTSFVTPYSETIGLSGSAAFFFIFYAIGMIGTRPIVSKLFDRKGATFVLIPGVIIFAISYLVLALADSPFSLLSAAVLIGIGLGSCQNTTLALAVNSVPRRRLSFASATYYAVFDICSSSGPMIAGSLIPFVGYRGMYTVAAIWTIISLPVYFAFRRKITKGVNLP